MEPHGLQELLGLQMILKESLTELSEKAPLFQWVVQEPSLPLRIMEPHGLQGLQGLQEIYMKSTMQITPF